MTHDGEAYRLRLSALLDGELSGTERDELTAHLENCEECRAYLAELTALRGALGELEEYDAPKGFAAGVLTRLHEEQRTEKPAKKAGRWYKWGALAACAAVVLLAAAVLPGTLRMGRSGGTATMSAPAAMAPVAPPDEYRSVQNDACATETAEAGGAYEEAAPEAPAEPGEPIPPTPAPGLESATGETQYRAASDAGVPTTIQMTGPNGETVAESEPEPAAPAAPTAPAGDAKNAAEAASELTLMGEGAAEWLRENAEPLGGGKWRVTVEAANALPDTLRLVGLQEPVDGALTVTFGTTENPR